MNAPVTVSPGLLTVVPCLNEAENLIPLLKGLLADSCNELIVVADGGSSDGSRDIVRAMARLHPRIVLLDNPDRIQSAGINRAVERFGSGRDWLLRIDAHCDYPPDFARKVIAAAQGRDADSVVVSMHTSATGGFASAVALAQNSRLGTGGAPHRGEGSGGYVEHGHHALMRIEAFRRAGGYCESMACNEDAELDIRLLRSGSRIWLEPSARIAYHPRRTPGGLARQYFHYGIGRATTVLRHRSYLSPRQMLPIAVAPIVLAALAGPWVPELALPALGWAALCQVWGVGLATSKRRWTGLLSGSAAMIMHGAWSVGFWTRVFSSRLAGQSATEASLPFRSKQAAETQRRIT
ncbi:MAG TPA: glycosyltransferase family 2 protein [Novosphingobium sp.]|nr:glycosyltransferase family 2 protein [Novosphingobium sp.]